MKFRSRNVTIIKPLFHGYIDYSLVCIFIIAAIFFDMTPEAQWLSYGLGCFFFVMTLFTDFPLGLFKIISLSTHGRIERVIGPSLLLVHFLFRENAVSHNF